MVLTSYEYAIFELIINNYLISIANKNVLEPKVIAVNIITAIKNKSKYMPIKTPYPILIQFFR